MKHIITLNPKFEIGQIVLIVKKKSQIEERVIVDIKTDINLKNGTPEIKYKYLIKNPNSTAHYPAQSWSTEDKLYANENELRDEVVEWIKEDYGEKIIDYIKYEYKKT